MSYITLFFLLIVAVVVLHTYVDQTSVLWAANFALFGINNTDFFALSEKNTF